MASTPCKYYCWCMLLSMPPNRYANIIYISYLFRVLFTKVPQCLATTWIELTFSVHFCIKSLNAATL